LSDSDLSVEFVIAIHDEIIEALGGCPGFAGGGKGGVESALFRVATHAHYAGLDDVFGIAAMYAEAIARGHVFNDANKRTGLTCALTYLERQGIPIKKDSILEEGTVMLAEGTWPRESFAWLLWHLHAIERSK
jgi:death-on-curing protein